MPEDKIDRVYSTDVLVVGGDGAGITHGLSVVKHISDNIMVMYLGQCVELASKMELFTNPLHPYTRALLKAIPVPDLRYKGKKREILKGEVSSPINPHPGCRFAPRCVEMNEQCSREAFELKEVSAGHFASCLVNL